MHLSLEQQPCTLKPLEAIGAGSLCIWSGGEGQAAVLMAGLGVYPHLSPWHAGGHFLLTPPLWCALSMPPPRTFLETAFLLPLSLLLPPLSPLPHCLPLLTCLPFLFPPYSFPWSGLFCWARRSQLGPPCNAQQMLGHWAPPTPFHPDTSPSVLRSFFLLRSILFLITRECTCVWIYV